VRPSIQTCRLVPLILVWLPGRAALAPPHIPWAGPRTSCRQQASRLCGGQTSRSCPLMPPPFHFSQCRALLCFCGQGHARAGLAAAAQLYDVGCAGAWGNWGGGGFTGGGRCGPCKACVLASWQALPAPWPIDSRLSIRYPSSLVHTAPGVRVSLGGTCTHADAGPGLPPLQLVSDFQASGRLDKEPDFSVDDKVGVCVCVCVWGGGVAACVVGGDSCLNG
jgi:hypothetical protein